MSNDQWYSPKLFIMFIFKNQLRGEKNPFDPPYGHYPFFTLNYDINVFNPKKKKSSIDGNK